MSETKTVNDMLKSIIRTFVPVVVGLILSALAQIGIEIEAAALAGLVDALFVGGYYAIVRFLESKSANLGWLLGLPSPPHYEVWTSQSGPPDAQTDTASDGDNDVDATRA